MRTLSTTLVLAFVLSACGGMSHDMANHGDDAAGKHSHDPIEIGADEPVPSVKLTILKDPVGGWNAHIQPTNFRFAPDHASMAHIAGEGHAHLMVNGEKLARVYGEWFHIPSLTKGTHTVTVSLNANSHAPLMVKGQAVEASVVVEAE